MSSESVVSPSRSTVQEVWDSLGGWPGGQSFKATETVAEIGRLAEQLRGMADLDVAAFARCVGMMCQVLRQRLETTNCAPHRSAGEITSPTTNQPGVPNPGGGGPLAVPIQDNLDFILPSSPDVVPQQTGTSAASGHVGVHPIDFNKLESAAGECRQSPTLSSRTREIGTNARSQRIIDSLVERFRAPSGPGVYVLIRQVYAEFFGNEPSPQEFQEIAKSFEQAMISRHGYSPLPPARPPPAGPITATPPSSGGVQRGRHTLNSAEADLDAYRLSHDH